MKNYYIYLIALLMSTFGFSQSDISITTSGGSFPGEKWVSITTGIDGSGTQIWGQGDGSQCNGAGLLTNEIVSLAPGTYYVNCYDQYDDSWDGTLISVEAYGSVIGDNGGVTPDDGLDTDVDFTCEGTPEELEASFQIIVPAPPACPPPTTIALVSAADTSAVIGWNAGGTETDWEIAVQAPGTGEPAGLGTATTNNPYTATGLTAETDYEVYLRADCGGSGLSDWVGPFNFTTACAVEIAPYTEDFENAGAVPDCWTLAGDEDWLFNTSGPNHVGNGGTLSGSTASGGYYAVVDDSTPDAVNAELITPLVDVSGLTVPAVSFYLISDNEGFSSATLTVDAWDGAAWNTVATLSGNTAGWEEQFISLGALTFTGPAQVRFSVADSGEFYDDIAIDDVRILEFPTCFNPSALSVDSFSASAATISWTTGASGETNWEVAVQADGTGTPAGAGDATSSNPYFALSLTPNTPYEVYLRADCGGGDFSEWIGPVDFTTDPINPPDCPASFTATPDASCGNFDTTISWDPVIADGYFITVGTTSGGNDILDNVDLGNVTTTTVPGQTNNTPYFYTISPYNIIGTNTTCAEQTYTTFVDACLCTSVPTSIDNNGITNVRIGFDDYPTTPVSYFDHSGPVNQLSQGVPINVEVTFATGFTYDTHIWIDLNDNGDLTDPGELVFSGESLATNPTTLDASFTVPSGFLGPHKMRIGTADSGQATPDPCYNGSFGVTLDFDVNITAPACTPAVIAGTEVVDNCLTGQYTVEVDVTDPGTAGFIVGLFPQPIVAGINVLGPWDFGTESTSIDIIDLTNSACNISLGTFNSVGSPVSDVAASNVTSTSADISWTVNGSETAWEVLILDAGDPAPAGTTSGTDTSGANPYTASGLTEQTSYDAYVRGLCGTDPEWVGPVTFTTPCAVIATPNYVANMSTNVPDACWEEAGSGEVIDGPGDFGASDWRQNRAYAFGPSNCLNLWQAVDREWLLSPTFDLSSGGPYQLEVNVAVTNYAFSGTTTTPDTMGSDDEVQLLVSVDGGATWSNLTTWNAGNQPDVAGTEYIEDLSAYTGNVQFAIWGSDGTTDDANDYDFHVGKFVVRTPPTCGDITALSIDTFDATSAQISWADAEGETTWEVAVQPAGTGTPAAAGTSTTNNPYTATGLTDGFAYEVYVRADCSGDGSNVGGWVGPVSFTTLNLPPNGPAGVTCVTGSSTYIFTEDFEDSSAWTGTINVGGDGDWEDGDSGSGGTGPSAAHSGSTFSFLYYEASSNATSTASAVSPAIDLTTAVDGAELSFFMHAYGADMGTLNVGVSTSPGGPFTTEFTFSGFLQTDAADAWAPVGVDLGAYLGQTIYIEFSHTGSGTGFEGDMAIDFVRVEACGSFCIDPTDVAVSNLSGSTADIAWTANGSETSWEVAVQAPGTGVPAGAGTAAATNPYTFTGLAPETAYEVYVRADCGSGTFSGWAGPVNFTTTVVCPDVSGIAINNITDSTANISWTNGGGVNETSWEVAVQAPGTGVPTGAGTAATNPYTATGLTAETTYEVYVRANCGVTDGFSGWSGPTTFTTTCAPISTDYTANMAVNVPDACWEEAGNGEIIDGPSNLGASDWRQNRAYAAGPSNALNLFTGNIDREWLLSPTFDLSAFTAPRLEVNVAVTNYAFSGTTTTPDTMGSDDEVQLLSSTDGGATWTNVTTWNAGNQPDVAGTELIINLGTSGTIQFAFWGSDGTVDDPEDYDFHVGKFVVRETPGCEDVTAINVSGLLGTSANIGWTNGDPGDTAWEVAVQTAGTGIPAGAGTPTATNPYSATGLTPETAYEVYVRTDCTGGGSGFSNWVGPVNFTTPCATFTPDYTEDFATFLNSCWSEATGGDLVAGPGSIGTGGWTADGFVNSGTTGAAKINYFGAGPDVDWLISPIFDLSADGYELVFDSSIVDWNGTTLTDTFNAGDVIQVVYSTDGTNWTVLYDLIANTPAAAGETITIDLTGITSSTAQFAIFTDEDPVNTTTRDVDVFIDNFIVRTPPSCPDVSAVMVSNVTTTTADISWTNGGPESNWEVAVQAAGTGEPAAADGSGADSATNPYNATGLTEATDYEVWVRAECIAGTEYSAWVGPVNFSTSCSTFALPLSEGFESGVPPTCWTSFRGTNGIGTTHDWISSATANSGSGAAFVRYSTGGGDAEDWLVTPAMDFSGSANPEVTFYTRDAFGFDYGSELTIRVSTTNTDHASFTTVDTITEADLTQTYAQFSVDLTAYNTATTVYVAFVWTNNDGDSLYLDDVLVWDNAPGTYTYNDGVWTPFTPGNDLDDIIVASGDLPIDSDFTCNSMTVNPGAGVIVDSGVTLEATNGLFLESSSTSYSSLITDGTIVGPMSYDRHVNINGSGTTGSNDLVSPPLTGQAFNQFAAANPNLFSNTAGDLFLFGPFEKVTGQYVNWSDTETSTLDAGVGYRAATDDNGSLTFVGTAENGVITNDIVNAGSNNAEWNLVGNPYPSYLNVQQFLLHDVGGVINIQLFEAATAAIYGYDGSALNGWTIYNLATTGASTVIAPGQGFFVSADATNVGPYDLEFTPAMRSTGSSDDFIVGRNADLTYVKLSASTNNDAFGTDIYFNANASLGFDLGYDAAVWGDTTPDFALYSSLVEDNSGRAMAIQAVNTTNLSDVVIPLGVNANQGEQLTFSIVDMNLPASVSVYLEDTVENTVTLLNDSDYIITPTTDLSGTGRFFLRTADDALSTIDNSLDKLDIFTLKASHELVVSGQLYDNNTMLNLYDIQGRLVLTTKLDNTVLQNRIDVSTINSGVYVVTIQSNEQERTKKVIID